MSQTRTGFGAGASFYGSSLSLDTGRVLDSRRQANRAADPGSSPEDNCAGPCLLGTMADFYFAVSGRAGIWSSNYPHRREESYLFHLGGCMCLSGSYLNNGQLLVLHPPISLVRSHIRNMIFLFSYWNIIDLLGDCSSQF